MERIIHIKLIILLLLLLVVIVVPLLPSPQHYVWGRIRIPARGIYAEAYTTEHGDDCIPTLWSGGKVTVKADLSEVQLYDTAELIGLEGEHYVLECVSITGMPAWLLKTSGDVLVVNGRWVYRFTRL